MAIKPSQRKDKKPVRKPAKKALKKPKKPTSKKVTNKTKAHTIEKGFENFGEEMGTWGDKFGRRMEKKGEKCETWFKDTFGLLGPLISSIIGIVLVAVFAWLIGVVNMPLSSNFIDGLRVFLMDRLGLFFMIFLLFAYTSHLSARYKRSYMPFSPLVDALGVVIILWLGAEVLTMANQGMDITLIYQIIAFVQVNLIYLYGIFLVIGYLILIAKTQFKGLCEKPEKKIKTVKERVKKSMYSPPQGNIKRVYRSGNDKILGGVCGGIAEYLGVDPVLVRLIWIIASLAWGSGIIAYIIAWIIIPRNPKHKWED